MCVGRCDCVLFTEKEKKKKKKNEANEGQPWVYIFTYFTDLVRSTMQKENTPTKTHTHSVSGNFLIRKNRHRG